MRDAFGGTFMLKLALVFFVIYVCFMGIAINYAKAFRVKNQVINIIEQYQYTGTTSAEDTKALTAINTYLDSVPYDFSSNNNVKQKCEDIASKTGSDYKFAESKGACIIPMGTAGPMGSSSRYYKVVTFINIDFNFFNIHMTIPISGETKAIYQ